MTTAGMIVLGIGAALFFYAVWWILTRKNDDTETGPLSGNDGWW